MRAMHREHCFVTFVAGCAVRTHESMMGGGWSGVQGAIFLGGKAEIKKFCGDEK